jgi:hypothetical protein
MAAASTIRSATLAHPDEAISERELLGHAQGEFFAYSLLLYPAAVPLINQSSISIYRKYHSQRYA